MSELTDIMIQALGGNAALVLVLVGLFALNAWQTRHFDRRMQHVDDRMGSVEQRIKRAENYLIGGEPATDGGQPVDDEEGGS